MDCQFYFDICTGHFPGGGGGGGGGDSFSVWIFMVSIRTSTILLDFLAVKKFQTSRNDILAD